MHEFNYFLKYYVSLYISFFMPTSGRVKRRNDSEIIIVDDDDGNRSISQRVRGIKCNHTCLLSTYSLRYRPITIIIVNDYDLRIVSPFHSSTSWHKKRYSLHNT
jgi:hypothetical protein